MEKYLVLTLLLLPLSCSSFEFKHHNNTELLKVLEGVHRECPNITRIYTLSETSVLGVPLYMIEFSTQPGIHVPLKPEFKYIANMHGNEVLGRELLLKLAHHLCQGYLSRDLKVHHLIERTRIHLMPSMNPDGWQISTDKGKDDYLLGRSNANGVDLNRDFPDLDRIMFGNENLPEEEGVNNHLMDQVKRLDHPVQPETLAVMRLIMATPFVLSANLHGGDLVANYPYDSTRTGVSSEYTETPDDDTFRHVSLAYSMAHPSMPDPKRRSCEPLDRNDGSLNFGKSRGIVNGAKWYSVRGGMQDFNYLSSNDFEITLELGCKKYTEEGDLEKEWENNKNSLVNFMWQTHIGVKGLVRDSISGNPISNAIIHVQNITSGPQPKDIDHDITSVNGGDYYRLLTPGEYLVTASLSGYTPQTRRVKVINHNLTEATRLDFWLTPEPLTPQALGDIEEDVESFPKVMDQQLLDSYIQKQNYKRNPNPYHNVMEAMEDTDDFQDNRQDPYQGQDPGQPSRDWLMYYMLHNIGNM